MWIYAGSRVADNELFSFFFDCSICSALNCTAGASRTCLDVQSESTGGSVDSRISSSSSPGWQCLEHETKHCSTASLCLSESGAWAKKKKRSIFPCKNKSLEEHTELRWFRILTTHCHFFPSFWHENLLFFLVSWECYMSSYCCIIKAHQGSEKKIQSFPLWL